MQSNLARYAQQNVINENDLYFDLFFTRVFFCSIGSFALAVKNHDRWMAAKWKSNAILSLCVGMSIGHVIKLIVGCTKRTGKREHKCSNILQQTFQIAILIWSYIFYEISLINKKKVLLQLESGGNGERKRVKNVDATDISDVRRACTFPSECAEGATCATRTVHSSLKHFSTNGCT